MTTYHVWLKGRDQPEVVNADYVQATDGALWFVNVQGGQSGGELATMFVNVEPVEQGHAMIIRQFQPDQWTKWSIVHDEADHGI